MTSTIMKQLLHDRGITQSLIRPSVSNDNPHCESSHRTIKHHRLARPTYATIEEACRTVTEIVDVYNSRDHHSGLNGYTPTEVFTGSRVTTARARQTAIEVYATTHPERFRVLPVIKTPPVEASINCGGPTGKTHSIPVTEQLLAG